MLEELLPAGVACAETRDDILDAPLLGVERIALGNAVDRRRREFVTGRACARRALSALGAEPVAIPTGPSGEPVWPAEIVGSITHTDGFRAAAVARSVLVRALGIDAEPNVALPEAVWEEVAFGVERERDDGPVAVDGAPGDPATILYPRRLLFSAKEAVYKAWFGLTGRWLGFEDVSLVLDLEGSGFTATLLVPGPVLEDGPLTRFDGRWAVGDGIICTAVTVPAAPRLANVGVSYST